MGFRNLIKNVIATKWTGRGHGLYNFVESSVHESPYKVFLDKGCTGGPNQAWATKSADLLPTQSGNLTLVANAEIPYGARYYITRLRLSVLGGVAWSATSPQGTPNVYLCDSLGFPVGCAIPFNALQGNATFAFPANNLSAPLLLGPNTAAWPWGAPVTTATYSATGPTLTAGAAVLPTSAAGANGMIGCIVRVVDGTGKGLTAIVASNTTTVLTLAAAFNGTVDATSVYAIDWVPIQTATSTTSQTLPNAAGTPYNASSLIGWNLTSLVNGSHPGQTRNISANTNAGALTLRDALANNLTAGDLVFIGDNIHMQGAVDLGVDKNYQIAQPNFAPPNTAGGGLFAAVNLCGGTSPVGSPLRIEWEGIVNY